MPAIHCSFRFEDCEQLFVVRTLFGVLWPEMRGCNFLSLPVTTFLKVFAEEIQFLWHFPPNFLEHGKMILIKDIVFIRPPIKKQIANLKFISDAA